MNAISHYISVIQHYITRCGFLLFDLQDDFVEITEPIVHLVPSFFSRLSQAFIDGAVWFILLILILSPLIIYLKRPWLRYILLGSALLNLGFYRGGCPCPVTAHAQLAALLSSSSAYWVLPALLLLIVIISSILYGRFFCGFVCPLGAVQELVGMLRKKHYPISHRMQKFGIILRSLVLLLMLVAAIKTGTYHFRFIDPFRTLFIFSGTTISWILLAGISILSIMINRPFCRFFCPLGILLETIARFSFFKIKLKKTCVACKACESLCPTDAINSTGAVDNNACIRCGKCIAGTQCFHLTGR